jgi:hypothetical protein
LSADAHASGSVITNGRSQRRELLQLRSEIASEKKRADEAERQAVAAQTARTAAEKKRKRAEAAAREAKKAKKLKPPATAKAEKAEPARMKALEKQLQDLRDTMATSSKDTITRPGRDTMNVDDSKTTTDLKVEKATAQAKYEVLKEQATLHQANLMEVAYILGSKQRIQPQSPHVVTGLRKTGMTLEDLSLLPKTERSDLYTATKLEVIEKSNIEVAILKLN